MDSLNLVIDKEKCIKCNQCIKDCLTCSIEADNEGYPKEKEGEKQCLKCQHCLAICPSGALSIFGKKPENSSEIKNEVKSDSFLNLVQSRRSVRFYKDENVSSEDLNKLKEILKFVPTGCNDHRLYFSIIDDKDVMNSFRNDTNKGVIKALSNPFIKLFLSKYKNFLSPIIQGEDIIFRGAPHLIAVSSPKDAPCADIDPMIALSYFELYAQTLGIATCWCGIAQGVLSNMPKIKNRLNIPASHKLSYIMLFGYPKVKYQRTVQPDDFEIYSVR